MKFTFRRQALVGEAKVSTGLGFGKVSFSAREQINSRRYFSHSNINLRKLMCVCENGSTESINFKYNLICKSCFEISDPAI